MRGASLLWEEGVYLRERNYTCTIYETSDASICMNTILKSLSTGPTLNEHTVYMCIT